MEFIMLYIYHLKSRAKKLCTKDHLIFPMLKYPDEFLHL